MPLPVVSAFSSPPSTGIAKILPEPWSGRVKMIVFPSGDQLCQ